MCLVVEHAHALKKIASLEVELALFKNPMRLMPAGTLDINTFSSILLDKLVEGDKAALYLADSYCKVFDKQAVIDFLDLAHVDKLIYVPESMDCDDFAAELYGKRLPLVWTNLHALNWFIDVNEEFWYVEPQTRKIARDLEDWQGWDVRFFINR